MVQEPWMHTTKKIGEQAKKGRIIMWNSYTWRWAHINIGTHAHTCAQYSKDNAKASCIRITILWSSVKNCKAPISFCKVAVLAL